MKIVIAGGTGFLGSALTQALDRAGHEVVVLSRSAGTDSPGHARAVVWRPDGTASGAWAREVNGAGAVINLAGEPLAARRWTPAQKQRLVDSRVRPTRSLAGAIRASAAPPRTFLSASGIGIYPHSDSLVDESSAPGSGFLQELCVTWEAEARRAEEAGARVVLLRSGVVMHREGGALPQLVPPFRFGVGGPLGSGAQWWAWVHRDDWVRMVVWALETTAVEGPLNVCTPQPARQKEIARAVGRALHRPSFIPAPSIALKLLLGEMAGEMLLSSQCAIPRVALDGGFTWTMPDLDAVVARELARA
ncbi:MAG: TIGR01777 family oxidoreductase [Acidobacteriota bacterium]|nr:TIGR01777 family oxidoreductase [Acidobacteriota bacterium]